MRLSRAGYGDIETIEKLDIKKFLQLVNYENYLTQYDSVIRQLNKKG